MPWEIMYLHYRSGVCFKNIIEDCSIKMIHILVNEYRYPCQGHPGCPANSACPEEVFSVFRTQLVTQ